MSHLHRRIRIAGLLTLLAAVTTGGVAAASTVPDTTPPGSDDTATSVATDNPFADIQGQFVPFEEPAAGSGDGLKIGFINLDDSVPYHHAVGVGMQAAADAAGAELVMCDAASDAEKALQCAQSFASQGVDGYINAQLDGDAAAGICAAGPQVPVLSQDILQSPCSTHLYGVNNAYAGYLGGQYLGNLMQEQVNCEYDAYLSLEAPVAGQLNTDRMDGYRMGFESVCGAIHDETVLEAFRIDNSQAAVGDALTALPDAKTIVVASVDDDAVLGALAAARAAGREDAIWAVGQGADSSAWCEIASNPHYSASIGYFPELWGQIAVTSIIGLINGDEVPETQFIENVAVDASNVADLYDTSDC